MADQESAASLEKEKYQQRFCVVLEEARQEYLARLSGQEKAAGQSAQVAEAALQSARDEWARVDLPLHSLELPV